MPGFIAPGAPESRVSRGSGAMRIPWRAGSADLNGIQQTGFMPEGDMVWYTARRLHEALAGRALTRSDFRVPRLATANLAGDTVTEAIARGKHLLIRTDNGFTVHTHLRMDGSWRVTAAAEPV